MSIHTGKNRPYISDGTLEMAYSQSVSFGKMKRISLYRESNVDFHVRVKRNLTSVSHLLHECDYVLYNSFHLITFNATCTLKQKEKPTSDLNLRCWSRCN